MRWRFADPNNPEEAAAKAAALAHIDAWWSAFAAAQDAFAAAFSRKNEFDVPAFMQQHLGAVHPDICWEFGPPLRAKDGHRLVITAESHRHLRPMVATLLERAPALRGWEFYPYRPPETVADAVATVQGRVGADYPDVRVRLARGQAHRVDVIYRSASFPSKDDPQSANAAFVFTESLLGEEAVDKWVGAIEYEPAPKRRALDKIVGRHTRDSEGFLPLERMKPTFDAVVASIRDQLPGKPMHAIDVRSDEHPWTNFQREIEEADDYPGRWDMYVGITSHYELTEATMSNAIFSSERFSRFGETFCYLKIEQISHDDRGKIEDRLDAVLTPGGVGRSIGGGMGARYAYIDLAIVTARLDEAVARVGALMRELHAPPRTWILFHDDDMLREWVGVWDDSPAPPAREDGSVG